MPLGEIPQLSQAVHQPRTDPHRVQHTHPKTLMAPLAFKGCQSLPEHVDRPPIVPQVEVHRAQIAMRHGLMDDIPTGGGEGQGTLAARDRVIIVTHGPERVRHAGKNLPQPPLVAQLFSECFGFAQVLQASSKFPELYQRTVQFTEQIDALCERLTLCRQVSEGDRRLLTTDDRLAVGRARHGFVAGLPIVGEGLVPPLAPEGMVGEPFDVLAQAVGVSRSRASTICAWTARRRSCRRLP